MHRPSIEKTTRYYIEKALSWNHRVQEEEEDQRKHGEETWKRIGEILLKAGENYKYSQRI
jgi:hypothetical protein